MNKSIIIFLILSNIYISISLQAGYLQYDEETTIDYYNNEFIINYFEGDSTFILVIIKTNWLLYYKIKCANSEEISDDTLWHSSFVILAKKGTCIIKITANLPFRLEGTILIHDINKEIDYDYNSTEIKNKYEYGSYLQSNLSVPNIIYSLPTFKEDFKANFTY